MNPHLSSIWPYFMGKVVFFVSFVIFLMQTIVFVFVTVKPLASAIGAINIFAFRTCKK